MAQAEQEHLGAQEAHRSLFEQRMQVDDRAMKMRVEIARRPTP
ncbi:hypothetical protein WMF45_49375 [Sorangium sp. So ce448]